MRDGVFEVRHDKCGVRLKPKTLNIKPNNNMSYITEHMAEFAQVLQKLDIDSIERMTDILAETRESGGRLFILGVGGSAANASHAVNDFRKICGMEGFCLRSRVNQIDNRD